MRLAFWLWLALCWGCGDDDTGEDASVPADSSPSDAAAPDSGDQDAGDIDDDAGQDDASVPVDSGSGGLEPLDYSDDALWLCRAGLGDDQCLSVDLTSTDIMPDGSRVVITHEPATDPAFDCFYLYPTVDLSLTVRNHTDLSDIGPMLDPLVSQAAWFTSACRVFAPLYRQATIGTLSSPFGQPVLDNAFADVEAAFRDYVDNHSDGRPFVVMGHSQGAFMADRLLREVVGADDALLDRLIVGLLVGGNTTLPTGQSTGGSLGVFSLCDTEEQVGCLMAYRTFGQGFAPLGTAGMTNPLNGHPQACRHPASPGGGEAPLARAYFPLSANEAAFRPAFVTPPDVDTPYVSYPGFYSAECVASLTGTYLEIRPSTQASDMRTNPINFGSTLYSPSFLGTHIIDFHFAIGDLVEMVETKAATHASR